MCVERERAVCEKLVVGGERAVEPPERLHLPERRRNNLIICQTLKGKQISPDERAQVSRTFSRKLRPEAALDCLGFAIFAGQQLVTRGSECVCERESEREKMRESLCVRE